MRRMDLEAEKWVQVEGGGGTEGRRESGGSGST